MIPYLDLKAIHNPIQKDILKAIQGVLEDSNYILGKNVEAFEKAYAAYTGTKYAVGVGNGLDAIILSLMALDIGSGDEVIVPANTYIATWLAVAKVGATIIPVEADLKTLNIDIHQIEGLITAKTKAIIPVHLYGKMVEMDKLLALADTYNLYIVEDNAQGHGAIYQGKKSGSFGILNATSFYPGKNLGCLGDGGAITTDHFGLYEKLKSLRNYGSKVKYFNEFIGVNSRLDEIQAAVLMVKLPHLDRWNEERRQLAACYDRLLSDVEELILPTLSKTEESVHHIYYIRTKKRDALQQHLQKRGIGTMIHYPLAPYAQKAFEPLHLASSSFPISQSISETILSLPLYVGMREAQIQQVASDTKDFFFKNKV